MKFTSCPLPSAWTDEESNASAAQLQPASFRLARVRYSMPAAPFASISSNLLSSLGKPGTSGSNRMEPVTGLEFPADYCFRPAKHGSACPDLMGIGLRAKKLFGLKNINIYALGIYVDTAGAKKALGPKFAKADAASLATDQKMFDEVVESEAFDKTLRMVISFGALKRQQFLDALERRLAPAVTAAGDTAALEAFKSQFDGVTFAKGMEVTFTHSGKSLVTKIDGQERGVLASPSLTRALFTTFLGPDATSADTKETFGKTLAAVLKS